MEQIMEKMWRNSHTRINRISAFLAIATIIYSLINSSLHVFLVGIIILTPCRLLFIIGTRAIRDKLWKTSPITFDLESALKDNGFTLVFTGNTSNNLSYSIKKSSNVSILEFSISTHYDFVSSIYFIEDAGRIICSVKDGRDCCFARITGFKREILIDTDHAYKIFSLLNIDPSSYMSGSCTRGLNVILSN